MKPLLLFVLLLISVFPARAQELKIVGQVRNSTDSGTIPFAKISLAGKKKIAVTNANGAFEVLLKAPPAGNLQLRVEALGIDSVFDLRPPFSQTYVLWVVPKGFEIEATTIRGLSAEEVVREAIRRIPQNYPTVGYLYYGFYRQYHLRNNMFQNLVEARMATLVRPRVRNNRLEADYRFLPLSMRRQPYKSIPVDGVDATDGIVEGVFEVDPVYNFERSSFLPTIVNGAVYRFDTTLTDLSKYIIQYTANSSSEDHGWEYVKGWFAGESYETGRLLIDRESFAFVHVERKTFRNEWYNYPFNNNVVFPSKRHLSELRDGQLDVWYKREGSQWILAALRHGFTNDFFLSKIISPICTGPEITLGQYYEWKTDSVSRYVAGEMLPQFYKSPMLHFVEAPKDTAVTWNAPLFFFFPKANVYSTAGWKEN